MNAPLRRQSLGGVSKSDAAIFARLNDLARWLSRDRYNRQRGVVPKRTSPNYPTSGDPNIIGEHEVEPVKCPCCGEAMPWPLIKGWRN